MSGKSSKPSLKISGSYWVAIGASLWATDSLFRSRLIGTYSPLSIVLVTQLLSSLVVLPVLWFFRQEIKKMHKLSWLAFLFLGVASNVLAMLAFTKAFALSTNYSIPVLVQKLQPLISISTAVFFLKEKLPKNYYWYAAVALLGSFLIAFGQESNLSLRSQDIEVVLYSLIAALFWGIGTTAGRYLSLQHSFWFITAMRYSIGLMFMILILPFYREELASLSLHGMTDAPIFVGMAFISGLAALFIYYRGLQVAPASVACWLELAFPLVAVTLNWIFLNSSLSGLQILGSIILIAAILKMSLDQIRRSSH